MCSLPYGYGVFLKVKQLYILRHRDLQTATKSKPEVLGGDASCSFRASTSPLKRDHWLLRRDVTTEAGPGAASDNDLWLTLQLRPQTTHRPQTT